MTHHSEILLAQLRVQPIDVNSGDDKAATARARQEYVEHRDAFLRKNAGATRQLAVVCCSGNGTLARGQRCNFVRPFIVVCARELPSTAAAAFRQVGAHAVAWDAADLAHLQSLSTSSTQVKALARLPPPNASSADVRKFNKTVMDGFMTHRRCNAAVAACELPAATRKTAEVSSKSKPPVGETPEAVATAHAPQSGHHPAGSAQAEQAGSFPAPSMQSIANQLVHMSKQLANMSNRVEKLEQQLAARGTKRRRSGYSSGSPSGGEEYESEEDQHELTRDQKIHQARGVRLIHDSKEVKWRQQLTMKELRQANLYTEHALAKARADDW